MDLELDFLYRNLPIHHLKRKELEYELRIRGLQVGKREARAILRKRFYDYRRAEEDRYPGVGRYMQRNSVDDEIWRVDRNVCEIKRNLNVEYDGGKREQLRTRLVHYLARIYRLSEYAEDDEDLSDIDKLAAVIRDQILIHFSYWQAFRLGSVFPWNQPSFVPQNPIPGNILPMAPNAFPYPSQSYVPTYPQMPKWHPLVANRSPRVNLPKNGALHPRGDRSDQEPQRSRKYSRKSKNQIVSNSVSNSPRCESGCSSSKPRNTQSESVSNSSGTESGWSSGKSDNTKRMSKSSREVSPVKSCKSTKIREPKVAFQNASRTGSGGSSDKARRVVGRGTVNESEWPKPFLDWWSEYDGNPQKEVFRSMMNTFAAASVPWSTISGVETQNRDRIWRS